MDTENKRITIAVILASVGVAFMSRLPQLLQGQQAIPWYQSGFFWVGIAIVIIALLILIISPKKWSGGWHSIHGFPNWIHKTYIWIRCRPNYIISDPIIEKVMIPSAWDNAPPEPQYTAKFSISVKNKAMPIRLRLYEAVVCIEQKTEWEKKTLCLGNMPRQPEIEFKPCDEGHWDLTVGTTHRGGPPINPFDLQKMYQWGIQRIYITLPKVGTRELHKEGLHRQ